MPKVSSSPKVFTMRGQIALLALVLLLLSLTVIAGAKTITVSPEGSIQSAINAASPNDVIQVQGGTYHEHIDVSKKLDLRGIGYPVIDAGGSGTAIILSANGSTIKGFKVKDFGTGCGDAGIEVASGQCIVDSNFVSSGSHGIMLLNSDLTNVVNNKVTDARNGIYLYESSQNRIYGNNINDNLIEGILLEKSDDNSIKGNSIRNNGGDGIYIFGPSIKNKILGNTFESNGAGMDGYAAIMLHSSSYGEISGNTIRNNPNGIWFISNSRKNVIRNNILKSNSYIGILLDNSRENVIGDNTLENNLYGILLMADYNILSGNIMINNGVLNALENYCHNQWDNGTIGNYYSNYDEPSEGCTDTNNNNICDKAYRIPREGNNPDRSRDRYPMKSTSLSNNFNHVATGPSRLVSGGTRETLNLSVNQSHVVLMVHNPVELPSKHEIIPKVHEAQ